MLYENLNGRGGWVFVLALSAAVLFFNALNEISSLSVNDGIVATIITKTLAAATDDSGRNNATLRNSMGYNSTSHRKHADGDEAVTSEMGTTVGQHEVEKGDNNHTQTGGVDVEEESSSSISSNKTALSRKQNNATDSINNDQHKVYNSTYLLYYTHSGFTNQILTLERAAYLALATNRTLVLPPIIPHKTINHANLTYAEFRYRTFGGGCKRSCSSIQTYDKQISNVRDDVRKAGDVDINFPSFTALFDFRELMHSTGARVIDMTEFAKISGNETSLSTNLWCTGTNETGDMLSKTRGGAFVYVVKHIQQACSPARRVVAVGSVFHMSIPEPGSRYFGKEVDEAFLSFFLSLPLTKEMTILLRELYLRLPSGYVGVHTRFRDLNNKINLMECDHPSVKNVYEQVLDGLLKQNVTNNTHILIGNSKKGTLECMKHHTRGWYSASTINSIIDKNGTLLGTIDQMQVDKSAVYLLLDMVLIGIADRVVFALERGFPVAYSTFQSRIQSLHGYRETIIERMHRLHRII